MIWLTLLIIPLWLFLFYGTIELLDWFARDDEIQIYPNWPLMFLISPVAFPLLLFCFIKRQVFYHAILLKVRLLERKQRRKKDG